MKPTIRHKKLLRKMLTPLDQRPPFWKYLLKGGKSGGWWYWYWIIMALFYAFTRPVWYAVIVHVVTLAVIVYGCWRNYHNRQA